MATGQMSEVVRHLRRAALLRDVAALTDGQLLEAFVRGRAEAAIEALVRRHGPMVWGVCRRALGDTADAEDAFQATFLVLVRRAASVVPREMVANWLYGVAHQTALKARATTAKRRARERQVRQMPEPDVGPQNLWDDLRPLLDQELSRLPDKYRVPVVLCDLEGSTRKEAARQLGLPEGTVASRLARARALLAKRLARHGLAVSGGALAAALAQGAASAGVPAAVMSSTVKVAHLLAAGQTAAGLFSPKVAALTDAVVRGLFLSKLKTAAVVLAVVGLAFSAVGFGLAAINDRTGADSPRPPAAEAAEPPARRRAAAPEAPKPRTDLEALQGSWRAVKTVARGVATDLEEGQGPVYTFHEGKVTITPAARQEQEKADPLSFGGRGSPWPPPMGGPWSRAGSPPTRGTAERSGNPTEPRGGPGAKRSWPPFGGGGWGDSSRMGTMRAAFGQSKGEFGVTLDEKATPKSMDRFLPATGADSMVLKGVYSLDGDTLVIQEAFSPWADRPTTLEAQRGSNWRLWVFERVKP